MDAVTLLASSCRLAVALGLLACGTREQSRSDTTAGELTSEGWIDVTATLDPADNARHATRISRSDSRIPVYVVPTDEELMIAQHTLALLMKRQSPNQTRAKAS